MTSDALSRDRPEDWPSAADVPRGVSPAWEAVEASREALRRERRAFDAEIRIAPSADLLARDDPPRPPELDLELRPEARLAWSPLRSEVLLAEARVLEAERAWIDAWRETTLSARTHAVDLDRARAELAAATRTVERLEPRAAEEPQPGPNRTAAPPNAAHTLGAPGFDLREARLDRNDAAAEVRAIEASFAEIGLAVPPGPAPRPEPVVPGMPDPVATRAYRALALRSAAEVARSERRWRDAVVPLLALEVGYAGSDARVEGGLELRHGRPSARVDAALVGTPQERGWARLAAAFRIGTDLVPVRADLRAARIDEVERLAAFEEAWYARWDDAVRTLEGRRERWRLAEDRLAATTDGDDGRGRLRDRARRAWLRMASAYDRLLDLAEAWPTWRPARHRQEPPSDEPA